MMNEEAILVEIRNIKENQQELKDEIKSMRQELTRYKGFVGGIIWVGGALVAAILVLIQSFGMKIGFH